MWLEFCTPTSGPADGAGALLPSPGLLYRGLHARIQGLLPAEVRLPELEEMVHAARVSAYELRTEMWDYQLHRRRIAGFLGLVELHVDRESRREVQLALHYLAGGRVLYGDRVWDGMGARNGAEGQCSAGCHAQLTSKHRCYKISSNRVVTELLLFFRAEWMVTIP